MSARPVRFPAFWPAPKAPRRLLAVITLAALTLAIGVTGTRPALAADCSGAGVTDFDGDGRDDVVVGDPFADLGAVEGAGAVHVLPVGRASGLVITSPAPHAGDGFGWAVRAGHLDADKCLDVVVGMPYADVNGQRDAGAVVVFFGGSGRRVVTITAPSPQRDAHFGWSAAVGEGLVVGAPYEDADGVPDSGAVYFYQPGQDGALGEPRRITQDTPGIVGNSEPGDLYGWALALGGLDGSKKGIDLAIGVPYENDDGNGRQLGGGTADAGGLAIVYDLTLSGPLRNVKIAMTDAAPNVKEHPGDLFGYALTYGQWGPPDGNGFVDGYLAVSAVGADAGAPAAGLVQIFQRKGGGKLTAMRTVRLGQGDLAGARPTRGAGLGRSLAFWNPGGVARLAIGSPFETNGVNQQAGLVRQIAVNGGEPVRVLPQDPGQAKPWEHYGWSVASSGGNDDLTPGPRLVVGSPDAGSSGAITLLDGDTPSNLAPGRTGTPALTGGRSADFGTSVAG